MAQFFQLLRKTSFQFVIFFAIFFFTEAPLASSGLGGCTTEEHKNGGVEFEKVRCEAAIGARAESHGQNVVVSFSGPNGSLPVKPGDVVSVKVMPLHNEINVARWSIDCQWKQKSSCPIAGRTPKSVEFVKFASLELVPFWYEVPIEASESWPKAPSMPILISNGGEKKYKCTQPVSGERGVKVDSIQGRLLFSSAANGSSASTKPIDFKNAVGHEANTLVTEPGNAGFELGSKTLSAPTISCSRGSKISGPNLTWVNDKKTSALKVIVERIRRK